MTSFAASGTVADGCGTVADGCERLRTVANRLRPKGDGWTVLASAGEMGKELEKKRKLAPAQARKFGLKKTQNRLFKTRHAIAYAGKTESRKPCGEGLKDVEQPSLELICSLSQAASRKFLEDHGVILKRKADAVFQWAATRPCADPDYRAMLRAACCLGCKLPNDSSADFVRTSEQTWTAARHKVTDPYHRYKLALAWQNCLDNNEISFAKDFVEAGSGRFGVKKRKASDPKRTPNAQNIGGSLIMLGRLARQWLVKGLPDRGGSSSRLGPETCAEPRPP
eukprot:s2442_g17.t1